MQHRGETTSPIASPALLKKLRRMDERSKRRTRAAEASAAKTGRYSWLPTLSVCLLSLSVVLNGRPRKTSTLYVQLFPLSSRAAHSRRAKLRAMPVATSKMSRIENHYEIGNDSRTDTSCRRPKKIQHVGVPSREYKRFERGNTGMVFSSPAAHLTIHTQYSGLAIMTKTRFTAADVRAMVRDLRSSVLGLRVVNVYDLDSKVSEYNLGKCHGTVAF